jgi:hypothetical protein
MFLRACFPVGARSSFVKTGLVNWLPTARCDAGREGRPEGRSGGHMTEE